MFLDKFISRGLIACTVALVLACPAPISAWSPNPITTSSDIELALEKLNVVGSALYFAAHPDDENTAMLSWFENKRHLRAGYLSITRGDGGQNLIGVEKGDLLGVIRTQELLAARRIDGAEQLFTRAIDFGYSKSADESIDFWGHEETLADAVLAIRRFQPDIVVTRFPGDGRGGHGHHTASTIIAHEAIEAAGDPTRFPEQLKTLKPWKPTRLFWNFWSWGDGPTDEERAKLIEIDEGDYEPLLGMSQTEISALSRSQHKCQGFGSAGWRGARPGYLKLQAGEAAGEDLLGGIDLTWNRIPGGGPIGKQIYEILENFHPHDPASSIPALSEVRGGMTGLLGRAGGEFDSMLRFKITEVDGLIRACAGLWLMADASKHSVPPGGSLSIEVSAVNRSDADLRLKRLELSDGLAALDVDRPLAGNERFVEQFDITIPESFDWERAQPYWLREPGGRGRFTVSDNSLIGTTENEPLLYVSFYFETGGQTIVYEMPVVFGWVDRVDGELYRPFRVVPAAALSFDRAVYLFPDEEARDVIVTVDAADSLTGELALHLPPGWNSTPSSSTVGMAPGESQQFRFQVSPPARAGEAILAAVLTTPDGTRHETEIITIDYPHIPIQTVFRRAEAKILHLEIERQGDHIAYVMGSGDEIPGCLEQAGYRVTELTDEDLARGDFEEYDAIVTGIRAYNTRDDLLLHQDRLLDYIEEGGTVVTQYNTTGFRSSLPPFGPYPLTPGRDRVTVEDAPVRFLREESSLLRTPNRITEDDFNGWIQERGLYFMSEWDPRYSPVLACHDPDEPDREGGLLVAPYGKGVFIYTGYSFFRQLPAGVPGAYRLFVNLVSARGESLSP